MEHQPSVPSRYPLARLRQKIRDMIFAADYHIPITGCSKEAFLEHCGELICEDYFSLDGIKPGDVISEEKMHVLAKEVIEDTAQYIDYMRKYLSAFEKPGF